MPGDGEVLVRVEAVGICGSDLHAYHGFDDRRPPPLVLGHEAAGTVLTGPSAGRRVVVNPLVTCGSCGFCDSGRAHLCRAREMTSSRLGPVLSPSFCARRSGTSFSIPPGLDTAKAALAEPLAVSYHAVHHGARLLAPPLAAARCAVLGGGAIGLAAALVLRMAGAGEILLGAPNAARRRTAEKAGVRCYEPGSSSEPRESSIDLVTDAVGAVATRSAASRLIKPGGVIVHVGLLPGSEGLDVRMITLQEVIFTGSYCYSPADFREVVDHLAAGRFGALDWFEERPLRDGARAFTDLDAGVIDSAKIVLRP